MGFSSEKAQCLILGTDKYTEKGNIRHFGTPTLSCPGRNEQKWYLLDWETIDHEKPVAFIINHICICSLAPLFASYLTFDHLCKFSKFLFYVPDFIGWRKTEISICYHPNTHWLFNYPWLSWF